MDQPQIELDDVGCDQAEHGEARWVGADVVQRHADAVVVGAVAVSQHLCRMGE